MIHNQFVRSSFANTKLPYIVQINHIIDINVFLNIPNFKLCNTNYPFIQTSSINQFDNKIQILVRGNNRDGQVQNKTHHIAYVDSKFDFNCFKNLDYCQYFGKSTFF